MAVSFRANSTNTGTSPALTAINPVVGAGAAPGDISILSVVMKPYNADVATPSGWTKMHEVVSGTDAPTTDDTGSVKLVVFYKISAVAGVGTGNLSFTGATSAQAHITTYANATGVWDITSTWGIDDSFGLNFSAVGQEGLNLAVGDWVHSIAGISGDPTTGSPSYVATGATFSTRTARGNTWSQTGPDVKIYSNSASVTAGSSNAIPTYSHSSTGSNTYGSMVLVRMREAPSTQISTLTDDFATKDLEKWTIWNGSADVASGQLTLPSSSSSVVRDGVAGNADDTVSIQYISGTLELSYQNIGSAGRTYIRITADAAAAGSTSDDYTTAPADHGLASFEGCYFRFYWFDENGVTSNVQVSPDGEEWYPWGGAGLASATWVRIGIGVGSGGSAAVADNFNMVGSATPTTPSGSGSGSVAFASGTASGTRTAAGTGSGTAAFAGSSTGVRTSSGTGAGSVDFAGSSTGEAPAEAPASGSSGGSVDFAGSATGLAVANGSASGSFDTTGDGAGSAPAVAPASGSASGNLDLTGAASGVRLTQGSASGVSAVSGTSSGTTVTRGSGATGTATFSGSSTGSITRTGEASGTWDAAGSGTGARTSAGSAEGAYLINTFATGYMVPSADPTNGWVEWSSSASGENEPYGSGEGTWHSSSEAVGEAPGVDNSTGTASGSWTADGTATGKRYNTGAASGAWTEAGSATGRTVTAGTGAGSWDVAGTSTGDATDIPMATGSASGSWNAVGSSNGDATDLPATTGEATGSWSTSGNSAGRAPVRGSASAGWSIGGSGSGVRQPRGSGSGGVTWGAVSTGEIAARGHAEAAFVLTGSASGMDPSNARDLTIDTMLCPDRYSADLVVRERLVLRLVGDRLHATLEET